MYDAIIISDIHINSDMLQAKQLLKFLETIETKKLILNGDVFDSMNFTRLKKTHWKVLSKIRHLSDKIETIWLSGNHDGPADLVSHLIGCKVLKEYIHEDILILHGDVFDEFLDDHPILTIIGDAIYRFLQWIDPSHYWAALAKNNSKLYLRCSEIIKTKSIAYAAKKGCKKVCCGHTHKAEIDRNYYNSGCWTELPCTYLAIKNGEISLHTFSDM